MLRNITEPSVRRTEFFRREFQAIGEPNGCGFSFDCDSEGNLTGHYEGQKENFAFAVAHPDKFVDLGVVKRVSEYLTPGSGICRCGERVPLVNQYMGACECPRCGQWYNIFGQELLPPEEWGNGCIY